MHKIFKMYRNRFPENKSQAWIFILGCFLFSLGAKCFIDSHLGVDPLDVLCIGMTKHLPITIGFASGIVAVFFLSVWTIWNREWPPIAPFITTFLVGNLIDVWNWLHLENLTSNLSPYVILLTGALLCAYSSALIIMSNVGIRIMDLVALTIVQRWHWQFISAKMFLELAMFSLGWFLGGPVGLGTVVFLLLVGSLIQPLMWINTNYFSITNYAMRGLAVKETA